MSRLAVNWFVVVVALGFILFSAWALFGSCEEKLWPKNLALQGVRIYYSDRTVDVLTMNEWKSAPNDDVQIIVVFFKETYRVADANVSGNWREEPYRYLCHSEDFYWFGGCGNAEQAFRHSERGTVKLGRWLRPNEAWEALYRKAEADKEPPKR